MKAPERDAAVLDALLDLISRLREAMRKTRLRFGTINRVLNDIAVSAVGEEEVKRQVKHALDLVGERSET